MCCSPVRLLAFQSSETSSQLATVRQRLRAIVSKAAGRRPPRRASVSTNAMHRQGWVDARDSLRWRGAGIEYD